MADFFTKEKELQEKVVYINRVAKVVKGGRRFSLTALVVVGDGQGKAGYGMGKASEVPSAIGKAIAQAKKNMVKITMKNSTIPHQIIGVYGAGRVLLKPASEGTGIIAGGPVRAVMDVAGVKDILAKSLGSSNPINMIRATFQGLQSLKRADQVAAMRGLKISDMFGGKPKKQISDARSRPSVKKKEQKKTKDEKIVGRVRQTGRTEKDKEKPKKVTKEKETKPESKNTKKAKAKTATKKSDK